MKVRISVIVCSLIILGASVGWAEGSTQLNAVVHRIGYPFKGEGGTDYIQTESAGLSLRINQGKLVTGMLNVTALFPYRYSEQIHPATSFTDIDGAKKPFLLDTLIGAGYMIDLSYIDFFMGTGFHLGLLFIEEGKSISSYGVGLDIQALVTWGEVFTLSAGVTGSLDFASDSTASQGKVDGLIWGLGFSCGIAVSY